PRTTTKSESRGAPRRDVAWCVVRSIEKSQQIIKFIDIDSESTTSRVANATHSIRDVTLSAVCKDIFWSKE
ncbi:MAG TPA: hypothetical protein VGZ04_02200, partial [Acidimicrobiales bacterium]|nr:hypothetical protein [Acidimicrobiales bacterium]